MDKLIVLIFTVVLLSGCATANPHYQRAQTITGTATSAGAGYLAAAALGANPQAAGWWALLTGIIGYNVMEGTQYEPPVQRPATAMTGNVIVVHTTPAYSSGSCGYGRYENPWSGGCVTQGFVDRNPEYLCCNRLARSYSSVAYATSERTATETKGSGRRLTADNYLQSDLIPPACQTDNPGADASCLKRQLPELREKQKLCNAGSPSCPTGFNPGKLAKEYTLLAQDLTARQNE